MDSDNTQVISLTVPERTLVRKITVGKPIRRLNLAGSGTGSIGELVNVDITGATTGSVLVFNEETGNFEATTLLESQNINGGQY